MELEPEARLTFLAEACGGEVELRREVDSLLQAHEQACGQEPEPLNQRLARVRTSY